MSTVSKPTTNRTKIYTYADYLTWDDSERWELIDGVPYLMAGPTPEHQKILGELFFHLRQHLRDRSCTPYMAPLDLTFEKDELTMTVVQPDVFVMCGEYGHDKGIVGVPVLVIEIISPSTATNDTIRKLNLYQQVGVQEYWIVEPATQIVHVYLRNGSDLRWTREYHPGNMLSPSMFPELMIPISTVFE